MSVTGRIQVTGLREFQRAIRDADSALAKRIRLVLNEAGQVIIDYSRSNMPRQSGRAAASLKLRSSQREARVAIGGNKAPYVPWLDFGGQGKIKGKPPPRPFLPEGRYVYKGLRVRRTEVQQIMADGLTALAAEAGLEAD